MPQPCFADMTAASRPLYVVDTENLDAWLATRPPSQAQWLRDTGFTANLGEIQPLPGHEGHMIGAVLGYGTAKDRKRRRFGLVKNIASLPAGAWHFEGLPEDHHTEAALGWLLAQYRFDRYKALPPVAALLKCPHHADQAHVLAMAAGEYLTRDLINTPAQDMGPAQLEAAFFALATQFGAKAEAVRGDELIAQNFPMIHAVGRAAAQAPRVLSLRWGQQGPRLTLVGKGVCFDTGGLDIKPAANMLLMKKDMGGAATVMGLAQMIMQLGLPLQLRVIVPAVENAISGNAMHPQDVLTARNGKTVEINNTDAEGRLILADALSWATEDRPDLLVSMATLTGAARVAVGPDLAPYYTDDDKAAQALEAGGNRQLDPLWRLPFHDAYETMLETPMADLDNAPGSGFAGSITAALFLRHFTEQTRYVHFDIYCYSPSDAPARPKGGLGQGARAILAALPGLLNI